MDSAILEATSQQFLSQWKRLVSTTNWDKGRIIQQWRAALIAVGVDPSDYCDDTWSREVGHVTPQHVGRLRRVFERFGEVRDAYEGLYWSHFQAALDWDDAEMWLEGAVQNDWSIAQMRRTRRETLGEVAEQNSQEDETAASDWDEDAEPLAAEGGQGTAEALSGKIDLVRPAQKNSPADETDGAPQDWSDDEETMGAEDEDQTAGRHRAEPLRPFANLASLPADVSEAFESFKLCILKHKLAGWAELSREDLLGALDALKELALAPAGV